MKHSPALSIGLGGMSRFGEPVLVAVILLAAIAGHTTPACGDDRPERLPQRLKITEAKANDLAVERRMTLYAPDADRTLDVVILFSHPKPPAREEGGLSDIVEGVVKTARQWFDEQERDARKLAARKARETVKEHAQPTIRVLYNNPAESVDHREQLRDQGYKGKARRRTVIDGQPLWVAVYARHTRPDSAKLGPMKLKTSVTFDPEPAADGGVRLNASVGGIQIAPEHRKPPESVPEEAWREAAVDLLRRMMTRSKQAVAERMNVRTIAVPPEAKEAFKRGEAYTHSIRVRFWGQPRTIDLKLRGEVVRQIDKPLGNEEEPAKQEFLDEIAGPKKAVIQHPKHGKLTGFAHLKPDGGMGFSIDFPKGRIESSKGGVKVKEGKLHGHMVSSSVLPAGVRTNSYKWPLFRLERRGDGETLTGHWFDGEGEPAGGIHLEPLEPNVESVKVIPRGGGALSWSDMQQRWRDGILNGNKPYVCVEIRGSDLPRYIGGDPNTYYTGFGGENHIELQDQTLTHHKNLANAAGTAVRVFFWLNFGEDRFTRPGRKVVMICDTPVAFDLKFEGYDAEPPVLESLEFVNAVGAGEDADAGTPNQPHRLIARYASKAGDDRKEASISIERDGQTVHTLDAAGGTLTAHPESRAVYIGDAFTPQHAAGSSFAFREGDLLVAELDGVTTKQRLSVPEAEDTDDAPHVDLAGGWKRVDDGTLFNLKQRGNDVYATYVKPSDRLADKYGFRPGDDAFSGKVTGNELDGALDVRFPLERRHDCPQKSGAPVHLELTLSEDGQTLRGRWGPKPILKQDCTVVESDWQPVTLKRDEAASITAEDLEGHWRGHGYMCDGEEHVELIRIDVRGQQVTATKVTGDACVPAGEITWKGRFAPEQFPVKFQASHGAGQDLFYVDKDVKIVDRDTLKCFRVKFRRVTDRIVNSDGCMIVMAGEPNAGEWNLSKRCPDDRSPRKSSLRRFADDIEGAEIVSEVDQNGNLREHVRWPDGTTNVLRADPNGNVEFTVGSPSGRIDRIARTDANGFTHATRQPDGTIVTEDRKENGELIRVTRHHPDGWVETIHADGDVTAYTTDGDTTTVVETDRNGNTVTATFDGQGNVIERDTDIIHPRQPGRNYYEHAIGGTDWAALPESAKRRYARREREIVNDLESEARRTANELRKKHEDLKLKAQTEANDAEMQAKLDAIAEEQAAAERRAAKRKARWRRALELQKHNERARELQRQYDEAVADGNEAEARRIAKLQEKHMEKGFDVLMPTEAERREMKQRRELRAHVGQLVRNRAESQAKAALANNDAWQDTKESVTGYSRWVSLGSEMQQQTARTTRTALRQRAHAGARLDVENALIGDHKKLKRTIETLNDKPGLKHLDPDDPGHQQQVLEILQDMHGVHQTQYTGAQEHLTSNGMITTAGYAIDAATVLAGSKAATATYRAATRAAVGTTRATLGKQAARKAARRAMRGERMLTKQRRLRNMMGGKNAADTTTQAAGRSALATDPSPSVGDRIGAGSRRVLGDRTVDAAKTVAARAADTVKTDVRDVPAKLRNRMTGRSASKTAGSPPPPKPWSEMTPAEKQAYHDAQQARQQLDFDPPDPGDDLLDTPPEPSFGGNFTDEEIARLHTPGRNLTREEVIRKAQLYIEQERADIARRAAKQEEMSPAEIAARETRYQHLVDRIERGKADADTLILRQPRDPFTSVGDDAVSATDATDVYRQPPPAEGSGPLWPDEPFDRRAVTQPDFHDQDGIPTWIDRRPREGSGTMRTGDRVDRGVPTQPDFRDQDGMTTRLDMPDISDVLRETGVREPVRLSAPSPSRQNYLHTPDRHGTSRSATADRVGDVARHLHQVTRDAPVKRGRWLRVPERLRMQIEQSMLDALLKQADAGDPEADRLYRELDQGTFDFEYEPGIAKPGMAVNRHRAVLNPLDGERLRSPGELADILLAAYEPQRE